MPRQRLTPFPASLRTLPAALGLVCSLMPGTPARAQSDAATALVEQGRYWQALGRNELAEESWRKLLRVDPNAPDALAGMAQLELARGNADAARSWIERLRAARPGDARLARLDEQLRRPAGAPAPANDLQRARAAAQAGRTEEAIRLYREVIGNQPVPEPLALEYYQVLGGSAQSWDEGRRGLEQLVQRNPGNAAYRLALARLQTYREPSRREGIRSLAELAGQGGGTATAAREAWRQALIWLDARASDTPLYEQYLSGRTDEAVNARLTRLREGAQASAQAQPLAQGYRALQQGDENTAQARFQDVLRQNPNDPEALGGLGVVRLRQQRYAEARQLLERASRGGQASQWAQALRSATYWQQVGEAQAARERNDSAAARRLYEQATRTDPAEPVARLGLADLQQAAGELGAAEENYRRVLQAQPAQAQALAGLVTVYTRQGRQADAQALLQRLTPEQVAQLGDLSALRAEQARAQAQQQLAAGDTAGAQRTLEDALLAAPNSPWVRLDLANLYRRAGLVPQTRAVMDGLLMSQPDMPDALYASALLAADTGDGRAGLQYLERIPAARRTPAMAQLQRRLFVQDRAAQATALARRGQVQAARELLSATQSSLGADLPAEPWSQLAEAYAEIGDAPRALAMGRQLLSRTPNPSVADRLRYGQLLLATRQDIELSALLRQLQASALTAAQRQDFDGLRSAYAIRQTDALRQVGNLEAAYAMLSPLLAERPDDAGVLGALARLYSAARDERQALALYQRVLQRQPTDLDTLLAAAASASALRDHDDAQTYVQAALKQAPGESRVLAAAGRVYRNAGDSRQAEQFLAAAVQAEARQAGLATAVPGAGGAAPASANPFAGMTGPAGSAGAWPGGLGTSTAPAAVAAYIPPPLSAGAVYASAGALPAPPAGWSGTAAPGALQPASASAYGAGAGTWPMATAGGDVLQPWPAGPVASPPVAASSAPAPSGGATRHRRAAGSGGATGTAAAPAQPAPPLAAAPASWPGPANAGAATPLWLPVPGAAVAGATSRSLPMVQVQARADTDWPTAPIAPAATTAVTATPLQAELADLQSARSPSLSVGTVLRARGGESGLSRLSDLQTPIEARFPVGEGKLVVSATPTLLDSGTPAADFATGARFGGGPQATLAQAYGSVAPAGAQDAAGVGLSVGYEGPQLSASIGTTPLGFAETNVIGKVAYQGSFSDSLSYKAELYRRPVTDSLLSFAGAKDSRTGERWGGVVASGGRYDMTYDNGTMGIYGYAGAAALNGTEVQDNARAELGAGLYFHVLKSAGSSLTAGVNLGLMHYDKNLSYFTYGHGGYFSPQRYFSLAFPVAWEGRSDRLSWRLNASLGVQSIQQDAADYFPTDSARQTAAATALRQAFAANLYTGVLDARYAAQSNTGLAYGLGAVVEYQVMPRMFLGGTVSLSNARNYREFSGGVYLRYLFDGGDTFGTGAGRGSGPSPLSSPYTPLL